LCKLLIFLEQALLIGQRVSRIVIPFGVGAFRFGHLKVYQQHEGFFLRV
jgi:hypothetical protein